METFYAQLMAPQDDALWRALARLLDLDRTQIQQMSSRFTWNGW